MGLKRWDGDREWFYIDEIYGYLGDFVDDYDVDAIIDDATEIDYSNGNRYWKDIDADTLEAIVRAHCYSEGTAKRD